MLQSGDGLDPFCYSTGRDAASREVSGNISRVGGRSRLNPRAACALPAACMEAAPASGTTTPAVPHTPHSPAATTVRARLEFANACFSHQVCRGTFLL